jgi:large subunit ribosomal protein L11
MSQKKVTVKFTLHMVAGKATPAPPVGPILGANGVNIGTFIKEFNDRTMDVAKQYPNMAVKVPAVITVYVDRTYEFTTLPPVTSHLIMSKANVTAWSAKPNKEKVGSVSEADLESIIDVKMPVMNTRKRASILNSLKGTAKSLGITVK